MRSCVDDGEEWRWLLLLLQPLLQEGSAVLEQQRLGDLQDVQVGVQGSAQALQHHDGKDDGGKVALQLHLPTKVAQ